MSARRRLPSCLLVAGLLAGCGGERAREPAAAARAVPPGTNLDMVEREIFGTIEQRLKPYYEGKKEPAVRGYNVGAGPGYAVLFLLQTQAVSTRKMLLNN